jgi:hypothetical protein
MKTKYLFEKFYFNPEDKAHRALLLKFINTSSWQPYCPFILEEPFTDIVSMCKHKVLRYYLDKDRLANLTLEAMTPKPKERTTRASRT